MSSASSSSAIPTPTVVVTELCKQKAAYVARWPVSDTKGLRPFTGFVTLICAGFITLGVFSTSRRTSVLHPSVETRKARRLFFLLPTVALVVAAFCFATFCLAVQHEFYCEPQPRWKNYNRDWSIAYFIWVCLLCGLIDWLYMATNLVLESLTGTAQRSRYPGSIVSLMIGAYVLVQILFALVFDSGFCLISAICRIVALPPPRYSSRLKSVFLYYWRKLYQYEAGPEDIQLVEIGSSISSGNGDGDGTTNAFGPQIQQGTTRTVPSNLQISLRHTSIREPPPVYQRNELPPPSYNMATPSGEQNDSSKGLQDDAA